MPPLLRNEFNLVACSSAVAPDAVIVQTSPSGGPMLTPEGVVPTISPTRPLVSDGTVILTDRDSLPSSLSALGPATMVSGILAPSSSTVVGV